jgi:anaerobic selenocysteine-containing dehydrogenase
MCGLEIKTEGKQVKTIKGDKLDPFSRGHICPKAVALKDLALF